MSDREGSSDLAAADEDVPHMTDSDCSDMSSSSDKEHQPFASFYQVPLRNRCNGDSDSDEAMQPPKLLKPTVGKATSEELRLKGNDFVKKLEYRKGIEKYKEAVKANPKDKVNVAKCNKNMSICYSELKDFCGAVWHAVVAFEAQPTYDLAYVRCGRAYLQMERPMMAALVYKKGLAILPRSEDIIKEMDRLNETNKTDVDRAEKYCRSRNRTNLDILAADLELNSNKGVIGVKKEEVIVKQKNEEEFTTMPDLIVSSNEDSDIDISDEDIENDDSKSPKMKNTNDMKSFIPESSPGAKVRNPLSPEPPVAFRYTSPPPAANMRNTNSKNSSTLEPATATLTNTDLDDSDDDHVSTKTQLNKKKNKEKILAEQKKLNEKRRAEERKEAKRKKELEDKKKENERKDQDRKEMEAIQKREEKKQLRTQRRDNSKQEIKVEFQKTCEDASTCLINMVPKSSMERYGEALEMCDKHHNDLWPATKYKYISHNEEVVVIKYMFAKACGQTNNYDCILAGLKRLDEIWDDHTAVKFPTVLYGYSVIWAKLNRYDRAAEAAKEGIDFLNQGFNVTRYNWPGIPSKLIQETTRDFLLEKLETLAAQLKYPPRPDVVCRWEKCGQVQSSLHIVPSKKIYFSDPDYKGYYRIYCHANCQVCYHKSCWMSVKGANIEKFKLSKSPTEKDFLGQSCFTPDCDDVVIKVEIIEDNGKITTVQDIKMIEKIEADERKCKEEDRIKRKREDNEKRLKNFETKQTQRKYEKFSSKNPKEKEENNNSIKNSIGLAKDRQYYFASQPQNANKDKIPHHIYCKSQRQEFMVEKKDMKTENPKEKNVFHWKEGSPLYYKVSRVDDMGDPILGDVNVNEQHKTNLNPSALEFEPLNKSEEHIKEKIFSYIIDAIRVNGPTKLDNDILWKGLDSSSKSLIFKKDFTLKDFLLNNSTQFTIFDQKVYLTWDVLSHVNGIPLTQHPIATAESTEQNAASTITNRGNEQSEEINETLSQKTTCIDSSLVSEKGADSLHALKPSLGVIARELKEKIMRKSVKELPEKISPIHDHTTDLEGIRTNFANNDDVDVAIKITSTVNTSVQTDITGVHEGDLDTFALEQQNENLILELQEMKDKFYKLQSERKLESKESNDKYMIVAVDNKKLKSENNEYKEQINKMKKAVTDATKISNELKKTIEALNHSKTQLEETQTYLREERCQNFQLKSQLTSVSQAKELESQTNDKLRVKLLENEFKNYSDILGQRQADNRRVITYLMESPELEHVPQVQLALSSLNEFSSRLLLADEELNNKYASLVRQSQGNETVNELNFDLNSVEPPNLGTSCLNLLHSFIIMNKHSSRLTSAPVSFTSVEPPPISRTSPSASSAQCILPTLNSRDASRARSSPMPPPGYTTERPSFPGIPEVGSRLPGPPLVRPVTSFRSSNTSQNSIESLPTSSPVPEPEVTQSEVKVDNLKKAFRPGSTAAYPTNPTSSRNTGVVKNSATYSTGANHDGGHPGDYAIHDGGQPGDYAIHDGGQPGEYAIHDGGQPGEYANHDGGQPGDYANHDGGQPGDYAPVKKGDFALVASLQKDHPSLSTRQALDYVKELRKSNNGKLSGMSTKDILKKLDAFIRRDKDIEGGFNTEDINCSICLEDMSDVGSDYMNPCRHRFHTACINQWLDSPGGAGSTCPMCRNYIVKEEEFPNLRPAKRF